MSAWFLDSELSTCLYGNKCYAGRNYSVETKLEGKIFLWVQLTHTNIIQ